MKLVSIEHDMPFSYWPIDIARRIFYKNSIFQTIRKGATYCKPYLFRVAQTYVNYTWKHNARKHFRTADSLFKILLSVASETG